MSDMKALQLTLRRVGAVLVVALAGIGNEVSEFALPGPFCSVPVLPSTCS